MSDVLHCIKKEGSNTGSNSKTLVLGTNMATCEGSSPFRPTIKML
jgi:hypothetical protein